MGDQARRSAFRPNDGSSLATLPARRALRPVLSPEVVAPEREAGGRLVVAPARPLATAPIESDYGEPAPCWVGLLVDLYG